LVWLEGQFIFPFYRHGKCQGKQPAHLHAKNLRRPANAGAVLGQVTPSHAASAADGDIKICSGYSGGTGRSGIRRSCVIASFGRGDQHRFSPGKALLASVATNRRAATGPNPFYMVNFHSILFFVDKLPNIMRKMKVKRI